MAIELTSAKPDDLYVRMDLMFRATTKAVITDKDGEPGWIEFWSPDAKVCKDALKRVQARLGILIERRDKRKIDPSELQMIKEMEEISALMVEGLAHRVKAWRLVHEDTQEVIEAPVTFENAKAVFSDNAHDLREIAQDFLRDASFTKRNNSNS